MRKKIMNGKRVVALALAFSMVASEAGMVVAAPAEGQAVQTVSENDVAADAAVKDTVTDQTEDLAADQVAALQVPGKVTNLHFEEGEKGVINPDLLWWNIDQIADGYEIKVVADGVEYVPGYPGDSVSQIDYARQDYREGRYYWLSDIENWFAYKLENNVYKPVTDKDGNYVQLKKGTAVSVYVRGYNEGFVDDGSYKTVYGEWSDPITYTLAAYKLEKVTNVKVEQSGDGKSRLTYNPGANESVELEIKDASGREYFAGWTPEWDSAAQKSIYSMLYYPEYGDCVNLNDIIAYVYETNPENGEPTQVQDLSAFKPGQTYTLRVRGRVPVDGKYQYSDWSEAVTYKCEIAKPEKPGQVKVDYAGRYLSWNAAKGAEGYEINITDAEGNWYTSEPESYETYIDDDWQWKYKIKDIDTSSCNIGLPDYSAYKLNADASYWNYVRDANGNVKKAGALGTAYTAKVRAYNIVAGERQYSDWTVFTFTIPSTVDKVKGVSVSKGWINWTASEADDGDSEIIYEVQVKDAAGNSYYPYGGYEYNEETQTYTFKNATTFNTGYNLTNLCRYQMVDGTPKVVIHPETGEDVSAYERGQTYSITVRAGRRLDGEDEMTYGSWSDTVTYTVPVNTISKGINAKPAKVSGLWIQTEAGEDEGPLSGPVMRWNDVEDVDRYEIEITDSKGNVYGEGYLEQNNNWQIRYVTVDNDEDDDESVEHSVGMSRLSGMYSYSKPAGSATVILKNADGTYARTFQKGETYKIRVRAVNRYEEYDKAAQKWKTAVEHKGDWSKAVTYTVAKKAGKVTDLKYTRADEDYYYFQYNATVADSEIYYQVATDKSFSSESIVNNWVQCGSSFGSKLEISKYENYLKPSTTYYVRVVNSIYGCPDYNDADRYNEILATAATTSFKTEADKKPKNITGLKIYSETSDTYVLRFKDVLKSGDGNYFEIQVSQNKDSENWKSIGYDRDYEGVTIDKSDLSEGTNYVRAVAYVWVYNEATQKDEKVYGKPSNVITIKLNQSSTTKIGTVKLVEEDDDYYVFSYSGKLRKDERVEIWYSDSKNFETNEKTVTTKFDLKDSNANKEIELYKPNLEPGKTYYVKARTYNSSAKTTKDKYSAFSKAVKVKTTIPKIEVEGASVTKTSITLTMKTSYGGWVSGYEIQRKSVKNKKTTWTTINASEASTYTDKKLKADTVYTYRVRPYYFNKDTHKTQNGSWVYYEAMTGWSGNLSLKAAASSKTSIKLSWNKVSGAKGYEVYRKVAVSDSTQTSKGVGNDYTSYKLITTCSATKKSYDDKKLTSGMDYEYKVRAYKTVGGKKVYIEEFALASLDFEMTNVCSYTKSNGQVVVTWNPVYSATGYLIEKKDPATGKWSTYKKINKAKTSTCTLPKTKNTEDRDEYRIRAYKGTKYTNAEFIYVYPVLAAPTKVTAKVTKNGIKVSWKAVSGADYYRVYRTTDANVKYNKDTKSYGYRDYYRGAEEVGRYVADKSQVSGYRERDLDEMKVTSVTDQAIVYSYNGVTNTLYEGPETGVKYYYFVVAYKNRPQHEYKEDNRNGDSIESGCSKAASATIKEAAPAKSTITKASSKSKSVTLTYKASKNADGYEIQRSTSKTKGYEVIGEVTSGTKLTYKDTYNKKTNALKKGKTYYYRVRAYRYNDDGTKVYSKYSAVKSVKVK